MNSPSDLISVTLLDVPQDQHTEMLEWLLDNHIEYFCFVSPSGLHDYPGHFINIPLRTRGLMDCVFKFEQADHAMLFKLAWHS